jgi:hypothetical protein
MVQFVFTLGALAAALPPITTPAEAVTELRAASIPPIDALRNVLAACKGKYRRGLRDAPLLKAELSERLGTAPNEVKKAILDLHPCFSNDQFLPLIVKALSFDDEIIAYGAEVAARIEEPKAIPALLDVLEERKERCLKPGLEPAALNACVWLTYAPSSAAPRADAAVKARALALAKAMKEAPYPKMKEVAAETIKASR